MSVGSLYSLRKFSYCSSNRQKNMLLSVLLLSVRVFALKCHVVFRRSKIQDNCQFQLGLLDGNHNILKIRQLFPKYSVFLFLLRATWQINSLKWIGLCHWKPAILWHSRVEFLLFSLQCKKSKLWCNFMEAFLAYVYCQSPDLCIITSLQAREDINEGNSERNRRPSCFL